MENPVFVDPRNFPVGQITIVLCNDAQGMLGWFIKWFTKGNYCHAFIMRKTGFACTQNNFYVEVPIENYLKDSEGLKFWTINNLTPDEFNLIDSTITKDLALPPWHRFYNFLGLAGQGLRLPWVSMPGQDICSQRVAEYLRLLPRLAAVVPEHPSPADLDTIFRANPNLFTNIGYWWQD